MKKLLVLTLSFAVCISASAQEKRLRAIKITTGYPNVVFDLEYPLTQGMVEAGIGIRL